MTQAPVMVSPLNVEVQLNSNTSKFGQKFLTDTNIALAYQILTQKAVRVLTTREEDTDDADDMEPGQEMGRYWKT